MRYRALTVAREFGSGGGRIAGAIAEWLGWKLLDNEIITAIADAARVDSRVVRGYDERAKSWLRRLNEEAIRGVAMASGDGVAEKDIFDGKRMAELTRKIIEEAHAAGGCVVVGRGAQCILAHKPDVYHVFVYAPFKARIERLKTRVAPGTDIAERIRAVDSERAKYTQQQFGKNWCDHQLYDLMIRSEEDEAATARSIYFAMTGEMKG
jgi:cytidylate kinase